MNELLTIKFIGKFIVKIEPKSIYLPAKFNILRK
nr:MAG TPA: hypothetical protein [Caudoviricetes sp.]